MQINDKRIMKINYLLLFGTILCSCVRVDDHPGVREHIVSQFLTKPENVYGKNMMTTTITKFR